MKLTAILYLSAALFLFICCNRADLAKAGSGDAASNEALLSEPPAPDPASEGEKTNAQPLPQQRKLIKEGTLNFETDDLSGTRKRIDAAIRKEQGYIASESENKYDENLSRTLVVRIPVKQFDAFIEEVSKGVERFDTKDIQTKDVTEQFVDIQARLKTKKEVEQRYIDLLKRANKMSEILEIEKQIGDLREEIEATEGRLRFLDNQSVYSTVTLTYYITTPHQNGFLGKFGQGFVNGWNNLLWFCVGLVNIWPFILVIVALIYFGRVWWRRRKKNVV
ncbi:protein of unknown function [bacterium A37T11]|nr:protein of unknown function [bacterium A37T11]